MIKKDIIIDDINYTKTKSISYNNGVDSIKFVNENFVDTGGGSSGDAIQVDTLSALPAIGKENSIYIIKNENAVYRWDSLNLKYECVGRNYENLKIINGGNAN